MSSSLDKNYAAAGQQHFLQANKSRMTVKSAEWQYVWVNTRQGVYWGAQLGTAVGIYKAFPARKIRIIPLYALYGGALFGSFMWTSAFFRNEL
jgi:hypothetical protein